MLPEWTMTMEHNEILAKHKHALQILAVYKQPSFVFIVPRLCRSRLKVCHDAVLCKIENLFGKCSSSKKLVRTLIELGFLRKFESEC